MADISRYKGGAAKRRKPGGRGKQIINEGAGSRLSRERRAALRTRPEPEEETPRRSEVVLTEDGAESRPTIQLPYERNETAEREVQERARSRDEDDFSVSGRGVRYRRRF